MKDIEDKLDGFEQVLAILVKKISVLESLLIDPKVPIDDLVRQMVAEMQASLAKMPSGNMMLSELSVIRKRLDAISSALENPKPVTFDWKAKSYLILLAVLLSTTAASLATIRCSNEEIEQGHRIAARYKMARQLFPRLTNTIDEAFGQTADPSIDSLQHAWESHDPELKKASNGRRKKR